MKFLIWGTGNIAEEVWSNGLSGEMMGFVETHKSKEEYKGYCVYDAEAIPEEYEYIIVANSFSNEIYDFCVNHKMDLDKFIFIRRGEHTRFIHDRGLRAMLGERNFTRYAATYGIWKGTFVEDDIKKYNEMNTRHDFEIQEKYLYPIVADKYGTNSGMNVYFWQDLWAAKHVIADGVKEHYDIGSRVDGLIAHLLAADIKVNMIDIRPFPGTAENLSVIIDDATSLKQFEDNSISSLSAMCSLEHFGLGRYGDPIDPEACFKCFAKIQQKLKRGGRLYISVPIGQDRVVFNAHRVFYADTIVGCFDKLDLVEYSVIIDRKIEYNVDIHKYDGYADENVTGLFYFVKG